MRAYTIGVGAPTARGKAKSVGHSAAGCIAEKELPTVMSDYAFVGDRVIKKSDAEDEKPAEEAEEDQHEDSAVEDAEAIAMTRS